MKTEEMMKWKGKKYSNKLSTFIEERKKDLKENDSCLIKALKTNIYCKINFFYFNNIPSTHFIQKIPKNHDMTV